MRHFALWFLKIYQRFLTLFAGYGSCRYYPTCSEYARWQFLHNGFLKACFFSILRILRCNQLFRGGIDYPVIDTKRILLLPTTTKLQPKNIVFWYVPKNSKSFYVVKAFKTNLKRENRDRQAE